jgi:hypothetical protein
MITLSSAHNNMNFDEPMKKNVHFDQTFIHEEKQSQNENF